MGVCGQSSGKLPCLQQQQELWSWVGIFHNFTDRLPQTYQSPEDREGEVQCA